VTTVFHQADVSITSKDKLYRSNVNHAGDSINTCMESTASLKLVACPDDGSPLDCSLLLSALQDEFGERASAVVSSLQQLPITDATAV